MVLLAGRWLNLYEKLYKSWIINKSETILNELKKSKKETIERLSLKWLNDNEIVELLNDKFCYSMYHISFSWDYNYLLSELYEKNKILFYQYISWTKFKYTKEHEYEFFTNIQWLSQVYIDNKEKTKADELFHELISFAELLIK